jgi:hypothetical protein
MTADANEAGPDPSSLPPKPARRRFRWRIIPVVLLSLYGGLAVLLGVDCVYNVLYGYDVLIDNTHFASNDQIQFMLLGNVFFGIHGCFAIAAGRYIWKRHWWRSVAAVAGAILLGIMWYASALVVYRMPPGPELPPHMAQTEHK